MHSPSLSDICSTEDTFHMRDYNEDTNILLMTITKSRIMLKRNTHEAYCNVGCISSFDLSSTF